MGADCSCFGNNTSDTTKNMDEFKADERTKMNADNELNEVILNLDLAVDIDKVPNVQGAVRGYLARKQYETPLAQAKENRNWTDIEKIYEKVDQPLNEIQGSVVSKLEQKLTPIHLEKPDDGVETVLKPPVRLGDGSVYQGEWDKKGKQHGIGTLVKEDGSKVLGCFKAGLLEGKGRVIESSGLVIDGEFKAGELNGNAKVVNKSGGKFDGQMANGKINGKGAEEWPDGTKYEGNYLNGIRHGKGKLILANGSMFEGDFFEGHMQGKGMLSYKNGNKYEGAFKDNKMNGKGVFSWADGRRYEGEFKNDVKNGRGKMTWNDGKVYDGEWKDGVQDGTGLYTFKNKSGALVTKKSKWEAGTRVEWIE